MHAVAHPQQRRVVTPVQTLCKGACKRKMLSSRWIEDGVHDAPHDGMKLLSVRASEQSTKDGREKRWGKSPFRCQNEETRAYMSEPPTQSTHSPQHLGPALRCNDLHGSETAAALGHDSTPFFEVLTSLDLSIEQVRLSRGGSINNQLIGGVPPACTVCDR